MKKISEAVRFAWQETGKLDTNLARRGIVFTGALGKIAHMRTVLTTESIIDDGYTEPSDATEEHYIGETIKNLANLTGIARVSENES